ncbi:hypothetical protein NGB36_02185 [Streptomyces sp. RB6PN25]|uniref:Uncharacterized protein n=1 Tax=Streptomyces humicola TaxID=2953240 RepID=A0ABT1PP56_9ACTN|nr:hypothetical protein [Streptomyces humicola]MCQ4079439.1 hypothetical protein [Streptomyces humicola]
MRAQRILGVTVASVALAMTGLVGPTAAQASDFGRHHHRHHHHHHHYRDCWRHHHWVRCRGRRGDGR